MSISQELSRDLLDTFRTSEVICPTDTSEDAGSRAVKVLGSLSKLLDKESHAGGGNADLRDFLTSNGIQLGSTNSGNANLRLEPAVEDGRHVLEALFEINGQDDALEAARIEVLWKRFADGLLDELLATDLNNVEDKGGHCEITLACGDEFNDLVKDPQVFTEQVQRLCMERPFLRSQLIALAGSTLGSVICRLESNKKITLEVAKGDRDNFRYETPEHFMRPSIMNPAGRPTVLRNRSRITGAKLVINALKRGHGVIFEKENYLCLRLSTKGVFDVSDMRFDPGNSFNGMTMQTLIDEGLYEVLEGLVKNKKQRKKLRNMAGRKKCVTDAWRDFDRVGPDIIEVNFY